MRQFTVKVTYEGEEMEVSGNYWKAESNPPLERGFEIESVIYKGIEVIGIIMDIEKLERLVEIELDR